MMGFHDLLTRLDTLMHPAHHTTPTPEDALDQVARLRKDLRNIDARLRAAETIVRSRLPLPRQERPE